MQNWMMLIIIGIVVLVIGLAIMNIPLGISGENIVQYLGVALAVIGAILIVLGVIFKALLHKP